MAELKLKILPDLGKLKKDLQDLLKNKFKIGVQGEGGAGGAAAGGGKKSTGLLGGIFKRLLPLGVLLSLKPITDILSLILNFAALGILLLFKWFKQFTEFKANLAIKIWEHIKTGFTWVVDKLIEWFSIIKEKLNNVRDKLVQWLKELPAKIWNFLKELPAKIWQFIKVSYEWLRENVPMLIQKVVNWLIAIKDKVVAKVAELKDKLVEKVKGLKDKIVQKFKEVKENLVAKLLELKDKIVEKFKALKDGVVEKLKTLVDKIKDLPQKIWDFIKGLPSLIASALKSALNWGKSWFGGGSTTVEDAIIKPNGQVIKTNPNDTIIATQTPNAGGSKVINLYGVTPVEIIDFLKRELSEDVNKLSRF